MKEMSKKCLTVALTILLATCAICFGVWAFCTENFDTQREVFVEAKNTQEFASMADQTPFASKTKVPVPVISNIVYDGLPHSATVPQSGLYDVVSNSAATNVGTYFVTLSLVDFANYEWDSLDTTTADISISFEITKREIEKPSSRSTFTYNFALQSVVEVSNFYTLNGTYAAVDVGNYQVDITLNDNCVWDDGTNEIFTINWSIMRIKVDIPDAPTNVVYNKTAQTADIVTSAYYTVVGGTHTSAGEYSVLVLLNDTSVYCWSNGSTAFLIFVWKIERAVVDFPSDLLSAVYNGRYQTANIAESPFYTVQNATHKNAGTYTVSVSLIDTVNCVWSDGTVDKIELEWTIKNHNAVLIVILVLSLLLIASALAAIGYVVFKSLALKLRTGR